MSLFSENMVAESLFQGSFNYIWYDHALFHPAARYICDVDPKDPHLHLYDVDDDSTIFQLGEWYHGFSTDDFNIFQATGSIP